MTAVTSIRLAPAGCHRATATPLATPIDPLRCQQLRHPLDRARDLEAAQRAAFVVALGSDPDDLRVDLARVLAKHERNVNERSIDPVERAAALLLDPHLGGQISPRARLTTWCFATI